VRDRIRVKIRDFDAKNNPLGVVEIDQAIADKYLALQSRLTSPQPLQTMTISAGASTFSLPTTVTQWTGNDGGAEYAGGVRIKLQSNGQFLRKLVPEEMDAYHDAQITLSQGVPDYFSLSEIKDQSVSGRIYPAALNAQTCDVYASLMADDPRDFIGSGSDDMDDVELLMGS